MRWCTSSCPFRSNQREWSIGRSPSEEFSTTPIFHNPFSTLFEPPLLACFTLLTTVSLSAAWLCPRDTCAITCHPLRWRNWRFKWLYVLTKAGRQRYFSLCHPPSWQTMVCDVTAEYPMYMPTQDDWQNSRIGWNGTTEWACKYQRYFCLFFSLLFSSLLRFSSFHVPSLLDFGDAFTSRFRWRFRL